MLLEEISKHISDVDAFAVDNAEQLENFRLKFLSKKGVLTDLYAQIKNIDASQRKEYGKQVNDFKVKAEEKYNSNKEKFESQETETTGIDITLPGEPKEVGSLQLREAASLGNASGIFSATGMRPYQIRKGMLGSSASTA